MPRAMILCKRNGHAGEWETSMMLVIRPELVGDHQAVRGALWRGLPPPRGWTMPDRSKPGHIGTPAAATAEKGETLLISFARRRMQLPQPHSRLGG